MLPLIYQDHDLLVVNKPSGLSLLEDRSGAPNLWSQAKAEFGKLHLVHRLDKGTSGVLLIARKASLQRRLTKAFQERRVSKYYCATVLGDLNLRGSGLIDLPLQPGRKSRFRIAAPRDAICRSQDRWHLDDNLQRDPNQPSHPSLSRLRLLQRLECEGEPAQTELLLAPTTGRTHQLRVHLAWIGYPILGDTLYGKPQSPEQRHPRLRLHARRVVVRGVGSFQAARPW